MRARSGPFRAFPRRRRPSAQTRSHIVGRAPDFPRGKPPRKPRRIGRDQKTHHKLRILDYIVRFGFVRCNRRAHATKTLNRIVRFCARLVVDAKSNYPRIVCARRLGPEVEVEGASQYIDAWGAIKWTLWIFQANPASLNNRCAAASNKAANKGRKKLYRMMMILDGKLVYCVSLSSRRSIFCISSDWTSNGGCNVYF